MVAPPPPHAHTPKKRKLGDQESPRSGSSSDGGSLDFINNLPDALLCTITSLLPTKDGARTQAVSCRWRPLWRSAPLNLVADYSLSGQERKRVFIVNKILAEHPGPAIRLGLPFIRLRHYAKIVLWLRSQALTSLQELDFGYDVEDWLLLSPLPPSPLPPSALRFAPTLRVAKFRCYDFPDLSVSSLNFPHLKELSMYRVTISDSSASSLNFPKLKQLTLYAVTISGDALHNTLSSCLSLESLLLDHNFGIGCLRISSPTLRSIAFSAAFMAKAATGFQELVIEDAPCLERLLPLNPDHGPTIIQVIRAPKLHALGLLSKGISKLHIGTTVFQEMTTISVTTTMHRVKVLAIDSIGPNLDSVIGFL